MKEIVDYISKNWVKTIRPAGEDGIPKPFCSPSIDGIYKDLFYWDTYFINIGLLINGDFKQVQNNLDDIAYFINKIGYMPNANHLLNRSQPPLFTRGVYEFWKKTGDDKIITRYVDTILKEMKFWKEKRTRKFGLNSYYVTDSEEMTLIHYNGLCERVQEYSDVKEEQLRIGVDIMSIAESGLDFNMRFKTKDSKIASSEFIHLDLNCILYDAEIKLAEMLRKINRIKEADEYGEKAKIRKDAINKYFLTKEGIYMDYNFVRNEFGTVLSAASMYPYIFGISDDKVSAKKIIDQLELPYGYTVCPYRGDDVYYQWDYPVIWGEMQLFLYWGLKNVHLDEDAKNLKDKFMSSIENLFMKYHKLFEKYDGITGELSNKEYNSTEMMGWTAAAYLYFASIKD